MSAKCSICQKVSQTSSPDTIIFGEWMTKSDITCHYFCLLLSSNLPQRGKDTAGILGFQIADIRKEIANAKKRRCMYCNEYSATIECKGCKEYFHLLCGHTNICLHEFIGEFQSYCQKCIPPDDDQMRAIMKKFSKESNILCYICMGQMGSYLQHTHRVRWIYAKCCGNGYAHSKCVKEYALNAGYYLNCIWCKDKRFRDDIKYQGVFVPDRDANWETERGAYADLYRSHRRCDMEICRCPKGRHFMSPKWQVIMCKLCGTFGAHNPSCIPGFEHNSATVNTFTCDTCSGTEHALLLNNTIFADGNNDETTHDLINRTLYINKELTKFKDIPHEDTMEFSDESESSIETVKNLKILRNQNVTRECFIPILTQSETLMDIENTADSQDSCKIVDKSVNANVALVGDDSNAVPIEVALVVDEDTKQTSNISGDGHSSGDNCKIVDKSVNANVALVGDDSNVDPNVALVVDEDPRQTTKISGVGVNSEELTPEESAAVDRLVKRLMDLFE